MIIELLTQKGFVQGVDYSFENGELVALEKTRTIIQEIEHPETPAELDEEGNVLTEAQDARIEQIEVLETYLAEIPSLQSLKHELVQASDPALLISQYLVGKDTTDDDSLNLDLFMKGQGGWRFANVPAPSIDALYELIAPVKSKVEQEKINAEAQAFLDATDWMVVRAMERGEELSPEFKAERQAARDRIVR
jgi:hypothetical protein